MRTVGIDLASQPKRTAACVIDWREGDARVIAVGLGITDDRIVDLAAWCDVVGIDAPFGWPRPFVDFVRAADEGLSLTVPANLNQLYFRATDHAVWNRVGKVPLAVAADKIPIPAMRCAALLSRLGVTDKSGDGRFFEVYPAAALRSWDLDGDLLGMDPKEKHRTLLARLELACPWLAFDAEARVLLESFRDAFDALIASLVTRAAMLELTVKPEAHDVERARHEGWIAVPFADSLGKLTG